MSKWPKPDIVETNLTPQELEFNFLTHFFQMFSHDPPFKISKKRCPDVSSGGSGDDLVRCEIGRNVRFGRNWLG